MDDFFQSLPPGATPPPHPGGSWKVLVVDDEPEMHRITRLTLGQFEFDRKPLELIHAYSAKEAIDILTVTPDIALALLDVVMETETAGLDVVQYIRDTLRDHAIRIVLRTGQPGQAPEDAVVAKHDINDYKDKTELTSQKLRTLLRSSIRSYRDIRILDRSREGLKSVIEASKGIFEQRALKQFVTGTRSQFEAILGIDHTDLYRLKNSAYEIRPEMVLESFDPDSPSLPVNQAPQIIQDAIVQKRNVFDPSEAALYCHNLSHCLVFHLHGFHKISDLDASLLNVFTENVTIALENVRLNEVLADNQKEVMYRIGEIVESRSKESGMHVKRVALYSELLGKLIGLPDERVDLIKQASPLHDIGKVGIPDSILHKPGKLDPEEWEIMKTHAKLGHDMLEGSEIEVFRIGAVIALSHHEKWDGSGYPSALAGGQIPIEGRLVALADVFDALGSDRCYKKAWPLEKVLELIRDQRGKHFDPDLVDLLLNNLPQFLAVRDRYKDEYVGSH